MFSNPKDLPMPSQRGSSWSIRHPRNLAVVQCLLDAGAATHERGRSREGLSRREKRDIKAQWHLCCCRDGLHPKSDGLQPNRFQARSFVVFRIFPRWTSGDPLIVAAENNHFDVVKALLEHGVADEKAGHRNKPRVLFTCFY